jgi:iron complex transport system substrate-binding protein
MRRTIVSLLTLSMLVFVACGDDAAPPTTSAAPIGVEQTAYPVRVAHDAGDTEISASPQRVAALSATHVEMLFALGAGDLLIAGDLFSNYPPDGVADLELIDSFNLSVESVIALGPDLVILSFDPGGAVDALEAAGIPTLLLGTALDLDAVYGQIETLGVALDRRAAAAELIAGMQSDIAGVVASATGDLEGVTFYHESDPFSFYTPNSSSFIGSLYALFGMDNIADEAPDKLGSGFPQLSPEFIVAADPDVVFLAGFGETPETFSAREGWDTMSAVSSSRVVVLDYDTASRWGPRVVNLVHAIAAGGGGEG